MAADRRPVVRAPDTRWRRLGELLQLRRGDLGYRRRPAFTRDHGINIRLVTDIENAYRPNTFLNPTLADIARAYQVTYDSVLAVLAGKADELVPAGPALAPAGPSGWKPPAGRDREDAVRPWFDQINERRIELAAQGITSPDGAQMFGKGTADADAWDGFGAGLEIRDRVWFIAELRRYADGRGPGPNTNAAGA
jgi:hypothetical protein